MTRRSKLTSAFAPICETATVYQGRPIVIELHSGYARLRLKGTREAFDLPYDAAYECAAKIQAREADKEKRR